MLTSVKLNATGLRWVNEFADFHLEIRNRPGKAKAHADTLLCVATQFRGMEGCSEVVSRDVLNVVTSSIHQTNSGQTAWLSSPAAVPDLL